MLPFSSCKTPSLLRLFYERHKRCSVVWTGTSCIVHSFVLINELCAKSGWFTLFFRHPSCCGIGIYDVDIVWYIWKKMWHSTTVPCLKLRDFFLLEVFHIPRRKQSIDKLCSFGKRQHVLGHPYHPPFPTTALFWPGFSLRKESNAKTSELLEEVENWKQKHLGQWRDTCEQW